MLKTNSRFKDNHKPKFKKADYRALLDIILKAAQDEYKQITYDRHNAQHAILRNYLWLATLLISVEGALFSNIIRGKNLPWVMEPGFFFICFSIAALLSSIAAFFLGIDTMRGRGKTFRQHQVSYENLIQMAYDGAELQKNDENVRLTMIRHLENAISIHSEACKAVGKKLRILSVLLLLSTLFSVLSVLTASSNLWFQLGLFVKKLFN